MIKLQELSDYLAGYLNVGEFKDYCTNGIQLRGKEEVKKIAFSTSSSLSIIDQAIDQGVDALIVHHGLFWDKDPRDIKGVLKEKIFKLLKSDISLICYHLPLDAHKIVGNNYQTLKSLGFDAIEPFETIGAKAMQHRDVEDLLATIHKKFNCEPICPPYSRKKIQSIACVTGGAHSYIKSAKQQGIDAFITGTSDEWVWDFAIENQMLFIPIGHYNSEKIGIQALMDHLVRHFGIKGVYLENFNPY